jgi:tight adherence protein B
LEFARIHNDIQTGATLKDALQKFYERHPLNDIKLFMTGTLVAAEAGPAVLVNTLKTIGKTIRNRDSQKKSVKSAIMQGKVTVYVMSGAPVVALVILLTFMQEYSAPLIETTIGKVLILVALVLDVIGYFAASKLTDTTSIVKY